MSKAKPVFLTLLFILSAVALPILVHIKSKMTLAPPEPLPSLTHILPKNQISPVEPPQAIPVPPTPGPAGYFGEKIIYEVKYGTLSLGRSQFNSVARVDFNGRQLNLSVFETNLSRFADTEKIYSDPQTALPVKVERDVLNWFSREKITEDYDQQNFAVTITKTKGNKQEKLVIKNTGPINNPVLLPYYIRCMPHLRIGTVLTANLPNRKFEIRMSSIESINVPAGQFKAYHFESTPKQIEIWISADKQRIPIKIQGTGVFGYLMVMKKYYPPAAASATSLFASTAQEK